MDATWKLEVNANLLHYYKKHLSNTNVQVTEECAAGGSPRRCGGQGDVLAGALATLLHWAATSPHLDQDPGPGPELLAAWGAARLTRGCAEVRTLAAAGPRLNTTVCRRLRTRSTAAARRPRTWWRWCTRSSADCTRVRPSCDPQPATTGDISADPPRPVKIINCHWSVHVNYL